MCGRYSNLTPVEAMRRLFAAGNGLLGEWQPRANLAPTQWLPVVRFNPATQTRSLDLLRWGLAPRWAADLSVGVKAINARAETLAERPTFREAFSKRRCLIPATGFYEWSGKQPYAIGRPDRSTIAFAGLWEGWRGPDGVVIRTFTIITQAPDEQVKPLHDRMPAILPPEAWPPWLGEIEASPEDLQALLAPAQTHGLVVTAESLSPGDASRQPPPDLFGR